MLKPILRDIRAVSGVTGVALLRKRDGYTDDIFPAAFTAEHAGELYRILADVYRHLRGFSQLRLSFDRVTVFIYNRPEFLLAATALPDLDQRIFEAVINSKFAALERALDALPLKGKPVDVAPRGPAAAASLADTLLLVLNRLSDKMISECGRTMVSRCWREARRAAGVAHPLLSLFTVDANGHWALRKGGQTPSGAEIGPALADLTERFLEQLGPHRPRGQEVLGSLMAQDSDRLEQAGFLHVLKSFRPARQSMRPS